MAKEKISLGFRVKHWFTYHPWLKIVALGLAILVWFYIKGELERFNF
jgi:hypothetical protein